MKKSIILITSSILLICVMYIPGYAQKTISSQFGIKGGVNFSTLFTKNSENNKMMTGFNVGIFSKIPITNNFAFQPELCYSTKGSEVTYNNIFVDGTARFKLDYVEMPLLLVINVTDNFNIHVGPYAAYLISGKVQNKSNINLFNFEDNITADDYNRFDAGVEAGAGIDFRSVSFGARYTYGLMKVGKEKKFLGTTYTFPDANNGVLNFYVAVSLNKN